MGQTKGADMARGIGIDLVRIGDVADRLDATECELDAMASPWAVRLFTPAELEMARARQQPAEFLAGRLAVKHAVRKAVGPLIDNEFDLRWVETLRAASGAPYVNVGAPDLHDALAAAAVDELLVSISNEGDYAAAIVLAQ